MFVTVDTSGPLLPVHRVYFSGVCQLIFELFLGRFRPAMWISVTLCRMPDESWPIFSEEVFNWFSGCGKNNLVHMVLLRGDIKTTFPILILAKIKWFWMTNQVLVRWNKRWSRTQQQGRYPFMIVIQRRVVWVWSSHYTRIDIWFFKVKISKTYLGISIGVVHNIWCTICFFKKVNKLSYVVRCHQLSLSWVKILCVGLRVYH